MHYIKVRKVKDTIEYLDKNMTIEEAIAKLGWVTKNKCINCEEQCVDCCLDCEDKIAIEKLVEHFKENVCK